MAHELKNKLVYQSITSITQVLLPLISYPYITRIVGPANLGQVNYVDFLSQMFVIFATFGVPFYGLREIARVRDDKVQRSILLRELSALLLLFSVIAVFIFFIATYSGRKENSLLYILAAANIILGAFSYDWYIQGMEAFRFAAIRSLLVRVSMLVAFFVFVKSSGDYPLYYAIFTTGSLLIVLMNASKMLSENGFNFNGQPLNYRRHLEPLWHFFLTSSAISIYIYFDTIILHHITGSNESVGYYTLPLKIVKICQLALLTAGMALLPRLSYLAGTDDVEGIKKYLGKLFNLVITAGLPLCAGMLLLAPEIIRVIAGEAFIPAVPVLRILSFLPFIIGLSNLFAFQVLVPFKKEKKFLTAVIAGCIISIGLNFLLIPYLSEQGAAITNVATEIFITAITGVYAFQVIQLDISMKPVFQSVTSILLFIPVVFFAKSLFTTALAILCFSIIVCGILYLCLQRFVFKNQFLKEMQEYLSAVSGIKK